MPVSRFDTFYNSPYQSIRTPLPFDELYGIAKNLQGEYEQGKAKVGELGQLEQALQAAPIHQDYKNSVINEYNNQINKLIEDAHGSYSSPEFQQKASNLVNNFKNDNRVQEIQATKHWWDKDYEPYANDPKNARNLDFTLERNPDGSYKQVNYGVYKTKVTPFEDYYKAKEDIMKGINEDAFEGSKGYDLSRGIQTGPNGEYFAYNKHSGGYERISKDKVARVAQLSTELYGNTNAGKHELQSLLYPHFGNQVYNLDYQGLKQLASSDPNYKQVFDAVNNEFANSLFKVGAKQIYNKTKSDVDTHFLNDQLFKDKYKQAQDASMLVGQNAESGTFNLLTSDPDFTKFKNSGLLYEDNGNIKIDLSKLDKNIQYNLQLPDGSIIHESDPKKAEQMYKSGQASAMMPVEVETPEARQQLISKIDDIARNIGWYNNHSKLESKDFESILSAYNIFAKTRLSSEVLAPTVQESENRRLSNSWGNYTAYNPENPDEVMPDSKPQLLPGSKIKSEQRIINSNGDQLIKGVMYNKDGTETPFVVKSNSKQENNYFGNIGAIGNDATKYIISNHEDTKKLPTVMVPIGNGQSRLFKKVVDNKPLGNGYYTTVVADSQDKTNQVYILNNPNTGDRKEFNNFGDYQRYANSMWYTTTLEGKSGVQNLRPTKDQYSELEGE